MLRYLRALVWNKNVWSLTFRIGRWVSRHMYATIMPIAKYFFVILVTGFFISLVKKSVHSECGRACAFSSVTVTNPHFSKINNRAVRRRLVILVIKCDGPGPLSKFCLVGELTYLGIFTVLEKSGCRIRGFQSHTFKRGSFIQPLKELQPIVAKPPASCS